MRFVLGRRSILPARRYPCSGYPGLRGAGASAIFVDVIESFGDQVTEDLYNGVDSARVRRIPADVIGRALDRLDQMAAAMSAQDLRVPPSNRLENLKGKLKAYQSIRVTLQWRLIFKWPPGQAGATEVRLDNHTYRAP